MPLKSLFVLSRYLDSLPRYKDSKWSCVHKNNEWIRDPVTHIFFLETRTMHFFQESRLSLVWTLG